MLNKSDIKDLHELVDYLISENYEERCESKSSILEILMFAEGVSFNLDEDLKCDIKRMRCKIDKLSQCVEKCYLEKFKGEKSMRRLSSHKVNEVNDGLSITVLDEPGQGGGHHHYTVSSDTFHSSFIFQNGPIKERGINGITNENLLAIVEDRLKCFQAGEYATHEGEQALNKIQECMIWLHKRTRDRELRGVEGTSEK